MRAGAIGFASKASKPNVGSSSSFNLSRFPKRGIVVSGRSRIEEKDEFFDDEDGGEKGGDDDDDDDGSVNDERWEDDEVDTDVLPTLLVYRGGELAHSWVRVDWEAKQGIEELLRRYAVFNNGLAGAEGSFRHDILTSPRHFGGNAGKLDDEDDLSDDGEELVFGNSDDDR